MTIRTKLPKYCLYKQSQIQQNHQLVKKIVEKIIRQPLISNDSIYAPLEHVSASKKHTRQKAGK